MKYRLRALGWDLAGSLRRLAAALAGPGTPERRRALESARNRLESARTVITTLLEQLAQATDAPGAAMDGPPGGHEPPRQSMVAFDALEKSMGELEVARSIQQTLIPSADLIERPALKIAGCFQPGTPYGGDFWTVRDLPGDKLLLLIGHATGHGLAPALINAMVKGACDAACSLDGAHLTAGGLLPLLNRVVCESARHRSVMTCFASIVDARAGTVRYANAGHPFPYLYRAAPQGQGGEDEFGALIARGYRLGERQESSWGWDEGPKPLLAGDVLIFYTDGLIECENAKRENYGERHFRASIRRAAGLGPVQMRDSLLAAAASFCGDRRAGGDITLVVARLAGAANAGPPPRAG